MNEREPDAIGQAGRVMTGLKLLAGLSISNFPGGNQVGKVALI